MPLWLSAFALVEFGVSESCFEVAVPAVLVNLVLNASEISTEKSQMQKAKSLQKLYALELHHAM